MDGVLKFLSNNPQCQYRINKKCFPQKTFGVSQDAPSEFKLQNSLVNLDRHLQRQSNQHYLSKLRYHSIVGNNHNTSSFSQEHNQRFNNDASCFKRKKGLLSEFMDKHAWKKCVTPLLGVQRNQEGRSLRNLEISRQKQESRAKRLSLHNINMQYSLKKGEKLCRQKDHLNSYSSTSKTVKLNCVEIFQNYFSKTPQPLLQDQQTNLDQLCFMQKSMVSQRESSSKNQRLITKRKNNIRLRELTSQADRRKPPIRLQN